MSIPRRSCRLVLLAIGLLAAPPTVHAAPVILDFSEAGLGSFDPNFFADRGVVFQEGLEVGFGQGDEGLSSTGFGDPPGPLVHAISGTFLNSDIQSMSIKVALSAQFVSDLQLAAFDRDGNLIGRTMVQLNQILFDPGFMGFGYIPVDLGPLPEPASSFLILNQFVRSQHAFGAQFGVSEITITPVPEPSAIGLLAFGLAMTGVLRRVWK